MQAGLRQLLDLGQHLEHVPGLGLEQEAVTRPEALVHQGAGQLDDTDPFATMFAVFASTLTKMHDPVFARIDIEIDVDALSDGAEPTPDCGCGIPTALLGRHPRAK